MATVNDEACSATTVSVDRSVTALSGLLMVLCLLAARFAGADPVSITNPGFEDLYFGSSLPPEYGGDVPTGTFPVGPPPAGWTAYN